MSLSAACLPSAPVRQLLHLRAGQSQMLHWPAGSVVTSHSGGAWLSETPYWLGEQLVRRRTRIEAHATHVLADSGWVVLWAEADAVLQLWQPAPVVARVSLASRLGHALAALQRLAGRPRYRPPTFFIRR